MGFEGKENQRKASENGKDHPNRGTHTHVNPAGKRIGIAAAGAAAVQKWRIGSTVTFNTPILPAHYSYTRFLILSHLCSTVTRVSNLSPGPVLNPQRNHTFEVGSLPCHALLYALWYTNVNISGAYHKKCILNFPLALGSAFLFVTAA